MPTYKVSFILDQVTDPDNGTIISTRDGGWTDNYYLTTATLQDALLKCHQYGRQRARTIAETGFVNGFRIAEDISTGIARAYPQNFSGNSNLRCDIPQMALALTLRGNTAKRTVYLRGLPDARVVGGAYSRTREFDNSVLGLISILTAGFGMKALVRTNPLLTVATIAVTGLVTTTLAHGFIAGDKIRFFRTRDIYGNPIKGTWTVGDPITATTFTLQGYNGAGGLIYGQVNTGKVRKVQIAFVGFTEGEIGDITTKKVGRPFDQYRGRSSARRR